jgi:hypothetical protein
MKVKIAYQLYGGYPNFFIAAPSHTGRCDEKKSK